MSVDTDLLTDDLISVVPETPVCGSPSWADAVTPELFSQSLSLDIPLRNVLANLMSSGARFDPVPALPWSTIGNTMRLNKDVSVYFACDMVTTTQEIHQGFDVTCIDIDFIASF